MSSNLTVQLELLREKNILNEKNKQQNQNEFPLFL